MHGQSPLAYYTFDNNTSFDHSGNNNHGTIHGNVTPVNGRMNDPCGAFHFDGKTGYIEIPSSNSLASIEKEFTFMTWYKFDTQYDNQWLTVLCKGQLTNETYDNPQYRFQVQQSPFSISNFCGPQLNPQHGFSTISINSEYTKCDLNYTDHPFEIGKWNFFAISYDGFKVVAYMNGEKVFEDIYQGSLLQNNSPLFIGKDEPGSPEYLEGALDDLRIFNDALSETEILHFFKEYKPITIVEEEIDLPENMYYQLPENSCEVKVTYPLPILKNNCNHLIVTQVAGLPIGTMFPKGTHRIGYEIAGDNDYIQRYYFQVFIRDVTPPILSNMPTDLTFQIDPSQDVIKCTYSEPIVTDNCEIIAIRRVTGPANGDMLKPGLYKVGYEAKDNSNNITYKEFSIRVNKSPYHFPSPSSPHPAMEQPLPATKDTVFLRNTPENKKLQPIKQDTADSDQTKQGIDSKDSTGNRLNIIQKIVEVTGDKFKVYLYDNAEIDGDMVTVLLNGDTIVYKQLLSASASEFELQLKNNFDNKLVFYAENLGSIPPNTGILIFNDGTQRQVIHFKSDFGSNGTIIIRKK